jgi:hypothetical protein
MSNPKTEIDTLGHFYDLRALAMSASAMTRTIDEGSDELNAVRRVLRCLADTSSSPFDTTHPAAA